MVILHKMIGVDERVDPVLAYVLVVVMVFALPVLEGIIYQELIVFNALTLRYALPVAALLIVLLVELGMII